MSERAMEFVENWVSDLVNGDAATASSDPALAVTWARKCLADAQAQGIPAIEINEQFDDLAAFIAGQVAEAKEREADRAETDE